MERRIVTGAVSRDARKKTEAPFTGVLVDPDKNEVFHCAACGNPIFYQQAKFESGSGWPSFNDAIPGSVTLFDDNSDGMQRIEVLCARCGAHLGHLFHDAPDQPTGNRFCINAVSLGNKEKKNL